MCPNRDMDYVNRSLLSSCLSPPSSLKLSSCAPCYPDSTSSSSSTQPTGFATNAASGWFLSALPTSCGRPSIRAQNLHRSTTLIGQLDEAGPTGGTGPLPCVVLDWVGFEGMGRIRSGAGCTSAGTATVDGTVGTLRGQNHFDAFSRAFLS